MDPPPGTFTLLLMCTAFPFHVAWAYEWAVHPIVTPATAHQCTFQGPLARSLPAAAGLPLTLSQRLKYKKNLCFVPRRVAGAGCFGASLMLQPELVGDACAAMRAAVGDTPITVKCRLGALPGQRGWHDASCSASAGADALGSVRAPCMLRPPPCHCFLLMM